MRQIPDYSDERYHGYCVLCGSGDGTRDHTPSRVFLDKPYPENLPVVIACRECNNSHSLDEEYLACLIECTIAGETAHDSIQRTKIKSILAAKKSLRILLDRCKSIGPDGVTRWLPDDERVRRVVVKLARGHVSYELGITHTEEPSTCCYVPLIELDTKARTQFESLAGLGPKAWPEIGSRSFTRAILGPDLSEDGWIVVQPERYRYAVFQDAGDTVRIVVAEYLACEVIWE
jgi:hypothetical protein